MKERHILVFGIRSGHYHKNLFLPLEWHLLRKHEEMLFRAHTTGTENNTLFCLLGISRNSNE